MVGACQSPASCNSTRPAPAAASDCAEPTRSLRARAEVAGDALDALIGPGAGDLTAGAAVAHLAAWSACPDHDRARRLLAGAVVHVERARRRPWVRSAVLHPWHLAATKAARRRPLASERAVTGTWRRRPVRRLRRLRSGRPCARFSSRRPTWFPWSMRRAR